LRLRAETGEVKGVLESAPFHLETHLAEIRVKEFLEWAITFRSMKPRTETTNSDHPLGYLPDNSISLRLGSNVFSMESCSKISRKWIGIRDEGDGDFGGVEFTRGGDGRDVGHVSCPGGNIVSCIKEDGHKDIYEINLLTP
jgi:hypothetical protein